MNIEITFNPPEHKGWTLKYQRQHNSVGCWQATKGSVTLFQDSPDKLIPAINEREMITVRLKHPIKALYKGQYDNAFQPAAVHAVANDLVYIRGNDGKELTTRLEHLRPGHKDEYGKVLLIHDSKENRRLLEAGVKLRREAAELIKKSEKLVLRVKHVTAADVLISAK